MQMFRRFKADQSGATAMIFGLSLVPLMGFAGCALDYSRAASVQTEFQRAVDIAALALVRDSASNPQADLQTKGRILFDNTVRVDPSVKVGSFTVTQTGPTIKVEASGSVTNAMMQVLGIPQTAVSAASTSTWGTQNVELALVLDNTGSMGDTISGQRKIDALKANAKDLLTSLRQMAVRSDSVKVSVVPFDTEVRLDPSLYGRNDWFRFGRGATPRNWTGYVFDRDSSYATSDAAPSSSAQDSLFPAPRDTEYHTNATLEQESTRDLSTMKPLTSLYGYGDYTSLTQMVDAMQPRGYTNIALGVMWGLATLSSGEPFTEASTAANAKKFMIVLTDGDNTMNHVNGSLSANVSQIDANTKDACTATKNANVEVFTIRLLKGNRSLLSDCSSGVGHYFDVQNATDLNSAFQRIHDAISRTRLSS